MYWEGQPARPARRAPVRAAPQRLRRHAALRRVPLVGRRRTRRGRRSKTHVPVAINTALTRHSLLGHRHRRLRPDQGVHRRALRALVPVRARSARCSARTAAPGSCACRGAGTPASSGPTRSAAPRPARPIPIPSELHNAAVEPICRKYLELRYRLMPYLYSAVREAHDTGHADHARALAALPGRPRGGRARR